MSRKLNWKRKYQRTAWLMTAAGNRAISSSSNQHPTIPPRQRDSAFADTDLIEGPVIVAVLLVMRRRRRRDILPNSAGVPE
ncbi:hypothetical protein [Cupriavidus sp. IDO]|uniref:hypothetical protein n=1 Tax=Cupriavidus sp. IDO TaxID=1539142 RepID=UPI00187C2764|nr:hypothetical protein [Cupriavidus sp. IDO]